MSKANKTYTPYIPDDLVKSVGILEALIACKVPTFADKETGDILVSMSYLAEMWGIDERTIKKAANKLQAMQILHHTSSHGRGIITKWEKGANYDSFISVKKVHNLQKKGTQNAPYNKDIINNNMRAGAREIFRRKKDMGETPKPPRKGKRLTRDEYYQLFGDDLVRTGWHFYKPEGYSRFIYEKL